VNTRIIVPLAAVLLLGAGWATAARTAPRGGSSESWRQVVAERVPLYGHRNWIVIVDSAYPAQSSPGIETVVADANHLEVVREVLKTLDASKHVRPIIYTDAELKYVPEKDAPGVTGYRTELEHTLGSRPASVLPHEEIISRLDDAGKTFKVLVIKTPLAIPYTSVFLQLDCGYWSAESEKALRAKMKASK
jgi:L-fucose mutarotase/ribose pyranase (RbsD/FucU family)